MASNAQNITIQQLQQQFQEILNRLNGVSPAGPSATPTSPGMTGAQGIDYFGQAFVDKTKAAAKAVTGFDSTTSDLLKTLNKLDTTLLRAIPGVVAYASTYKLLKADLGPVGNSLAALPREAYKASVAFNDATGAGGEFDAQIVQLRDDLKAFPGIADAVAVSAAALYKGFSDFSGPDGIQRSEVEIAKTVAMLSKLGGSVEDQTSIIQNLRMGFLQNDEQINNSLLQFEALSEALDVDLGTVMRNFSRQAPLFSSFADQGVHAFKRLQAQSKATGVEVDSLVKVSEKFTTIEGTASIIGQLQQLAPGGDLDFMALTEAALTDPSEVADMLMEYLEDVNLESANPATQRIFENILGLSIPELKALATRRTDETKALAMGAKITPEAEIAAKIAAAATVEENIQASIANANVIPAEIGEVLKSNELNAFRQALVGTEQVSEVLGSYLQESGVTELLSGLKSFVADANQRMMTPSDSGWEQLVANNAKELKEAFKGIRFEVTMNGDVVGRMVAKEFSGGG